MSTTDHDNRPLILISNDDGINAPGLKALIDYTAPLQGRIIAVAPSAPRSGASASITVETILRAHKHSEQYHGAELWEVTGTPVDCVKLALHTLLPRTPDLMLSGINHGSNSGNSVVYSGTMGAAGEAAMAGIPAIGFSLLHHSWAADFSQCAPIVAELSAKVLKSGLPDGVCLNVNIPARCTPLGLKVVRAAHGHWTEDYKEYTDTAGNPFYMLSGKFINDEPDDDGTDQYWLDRQYATIAPYAPERTETDAIPQLTKLLIG